MALPINISQSLLKELFDYFEGKLCGLQFEAKNIKKISFPSSPVQRLGYFFENLCTGALPRDGASHLPEVKMVKEGEISQPALTAPYERMYRQAERFKKTIARYDIKILEPSQTLQYKNKKAILDFRGTIAGVEAMFDIKSTGLIDDAYNEMGWHRDALAHKEKIMIQPVFSKWLWRKIYGNDIPFYFLVFSNTNEYDCRFFEVVVDEPRMASFELLLKNAERMLEEEINRGFKAHPDVKECATCPIKDGCKHFIDTPILEKIYY